MRRVERWLLGPAPPERLAMLRVMILGYATAFLVARGSAFWSAAGRPPWQWRPVGVLSWLDEAPAASLVRGLFVMAVVAGVAATAGWRYRITGPLFATLFLVVTTHRLSWGSVLHTEHLVVLHVIILGLAPAAAVWSLDARRHHGGAVPAPDSRFGWPVQTMALATVVGYVVAGVAKVRYGGDDWLVGDVLRHQVAFDNLRKVLLGDHHSPLGGWVVQFGFLFPPMAWTTVLVELAAPLALLGGRLRTVWATAAWGFHVGIVALMAIVFPYPLLGIAYAPLFAVERLATWRPFTRRRRPTPPDGLPASPRAAFAAPRSHPPADAHRRGPVWADESRSPRRPRR
jgi:hypothetical protein